MKWLLHHYHRLHAVGELIPFLVFVLAGFQDQFSYRPERDGLAIGILLSIGEIEPVTLTRQVFVTLDRGS
jgi:hypothetical protein